MILTVLPSYNVLFCSISGELSSEKTERVKFVSDHLCQVSGFKSCFTRKVSHSNVQTYKHLLGFRHVSSSIVLQHSKTLLYKYSKSTRQMSNGLNLIVDWLISVTPSHRKEWCTNSHSKTNIKTRQHIANHTFRTNIEVQMRYQLERCSFWSYLRMANSK